jgi:hypothetical protein
MIRKNGHPNGASTSDYEEAFFKIADTIRTKAQSFLYFMNVPIVHAPPFTREKN